MGWNRRLPRKEGAANLALRRLIKPEEDLRQANASTHVGERYAHFENTLETLLKIELGEELHTTYRAIPADRSSVAGADL